MTPSRVVRWVTTRTLTSTQFKTSQRCALGAKCKRRPDRQGLPPQAGRGPCVCMGTHVIIASDFSQGPPMCEAKGDSCKARFRNCNAEICSGYTWLSDIASLLLRRNSYKYFFLSGYGPSLAPFALHNQARSRSSELVGGGMPEHFRPAWAWSGQLGALPSSHLG
jgi:hypothetical protein